jgi:hypothetical protein
VRERDIMTTKLNLLLLPGSARVRRRKILSLALPSIRGAKGKEEDEVPAWLKELISNVPRSSLDVNILIGRLSEAIEIVQARKRASDFSGFREMVELDDDDDD